MIYVGTFHRTMDAKNRVTVPSDWLGEEGEVLYMLPSQSGSYLNVMPAAELAQQEEALRATVPAGEWRKIMRKIFAPARRIEPDKQGRILIPDDFCKEVGLRANITFAGVKKSFEIWDAEKWSSGPQPETELSEESRKALEALGY
jgi:MraZ protein